MSNSIFIFNLSFYSQSKLIILINVTKADLENFCQCRMLVKINSPFARTIRPTNSRHSAVSTCFVSPCVIYCIWLWNNWGRISFSGCFNYYYHELNMFISIRFYPFPPNDLACFWSFVVSMAFYILQIKSVQTGTSAKWNVLHRHQKPKIWFY